MRARRRGGGLFLGLLIAGTLWIVATTVAAVLQVGPMRDVACPSASGFRVAQQVELHLVPFGPACRIEERDTSGALTGRGVEWGPAPVWGRALLAGAVTALVGAVGLVRARPRAGRPALSDR